MRHNFAPRLAQDDSINRAMTAIAAENIEALLAYQTHEGMPEHRAAGAEWVAMGGVAAEAERLLVTCGGQHGTAVAFNTLLEPGDTLFADDLDAMGFNLVGYGCTTCIGNSGPLPTEISQAINKNDLVAAAVLSGNRNFEGRVSPDVKANYLASPPLVVAYALAGSMQIDLTTEPLGTGSNGQPVYLKDIWPTTQEVAETVRSCVTPEMFRKRYGNVFDGDANWQSIKVTGGLTYDWDADSTYVQNPPYFEHLSTRTDADRGCEGGPHPGPLRGLDHHRPHLAGRQHQGAEPCRLLP